MTNEQPSSETISITLPNGRVAASVTNLLLRKKPIGWSRRSYGSYYKEAYGEWVKRILDSMAANGRPKLIPYGSIPGVSNTSLYLRFQQGKMYLLDEMDFDGKYKKLSSKIKGRRAKDGLVLEWDTIASELPDAVEVVSVRDKPKWKKELDDYLENDNPTGEPFHKTNLQLTDVEVEQQIRELDGLENVMFSVTHREIKVIKGV